MNVNDMYFEDFRFGDKKLSDFGGIIYNEDGWFISNGLTSAKTTTKLSNRDGELFLSSTYNPRTITIPIFLQRNIDLDEFFAWLLNGEQELEFVNSGRKINVILDNQIDIRNYYDGVYKGLSTLSFIAYDPYWKNIVDTYTIKQPPRVNQTVSFRIEGNTICYPKINLQPTTVGKVKFEINGMIVTLDITNSLVNKNITIDCEREDVYGVTGTSEENLFQIYSSNDYYEFPTLNPFVDNTFTLQSGNASVVKIYHNDRWI